MAVLLHRLWVSGEVYEPLRKSEGDERSGIEKPGRERIYTEQLGSTAEFRRLRLSPSPTSLVKKEVEDANQVAAPTESRTPNWHRAKIAHTRVRMEGWRQRRLGWTGKIEGPKRERYSPLTRTGLLMEGPWRCECNCDGSICVMEILQQLSGRSDVISF